MRCRLRAVSVIFGMILLDLVLPKDITSHGPQIAVMGPIWVTHG